MRTLIVDGYNVIHHASAYERLLEREDVDTARAALVSDVAAYAQGEYRATVVFDGGSNPGSSGQPHETAGVSVVFSAYGTDGDAAVAATARAARDRGDEVVVVTSDADLQWTVLGMGCTRMSAVELVAALTEGASEMREHTPSGSKKGTFAERLPADIRARLDRWARGLD